MDRSCIEVRRFAHFQNVFLLCTAACIDIGWTHLNMCIIYPSLRAPTEYYNIMTTTAKNSATLDRECGLLITIVLCTVYVYICI